MALRMLAELRWPVPEMRSLPSLPPSLLVCEGSTHMDSLALSSPVDSQKESDVHAKETLETAVLGT